MTKERSDSSLNTSLGEQLRAIRLARGLTQEQLAEELGVSPRYLAGVERAERNMSLATVESLAEQLGLTPRIVLDSGADSAG
ncbi:helix-turn-helix domain-containing protein [Brevibacterium linens]|uniref:DNA-binding transcriptional regulator, XRE-family HTH domain n=1 Tax=Brevibacterium linens TaxID=1703 RepID=A0A2H1KEX2_BRELN|nr:helix-turn-helix transcriptional regulator [Brevibacterium linens]SMX98385.1 DNA-binding transcriptional regulator, XRE-family HTH domain [Brevibacterium linens]